MEQNMQYLMWIKSKQLLNSHLQAAASMNSYHTSWEEQAFAEDAAGPLGGFVWPPRSYSCTFCKREFRSAQALGGHMNVHRRDRARLKQSLCNENPSLLPATGTVHDLQDHHHSPDDHQGNDSGGSNSNSGLFAASSPFSSSPNSRASAAAVISQENSSEEAYISPFSSIIVREQQRRFPYSPSSPDHSNSVRLLSISSDSRTSTPVRLRYRDHDEDAIETNLSVGINSHTEELAINHSKRLKSSSSTFPFYHKPCSSDRFPFQYASSIDDIDLELRLGEAPAVK